MTEGKEEKRLVQIAERSISLFSAKYDQIFIFRNVFVSLHYASVSSKATARGVMFLGCRSICSFVHTSHSCERNIDECLKFGTDVH